MATWALSATKLPTRVIAGDSRVSLVSFLKAKPRTAIFFPARLWKRQEMIRLVKRCFWYSFMFMMARQ